MSILKQIITAELESKSKVEQAKEEQEKELQKVASFVKDEQKRSAKELKERIAQINSETQETKAKMEQEYTLKAEQIKKDVEKSATAKRKKIFDKLVKEIIAL